MNVMLQASKTVILIVSPGEIPFWMESPPVELSIPLFTLIHRYHVGIELKPIRIELRHKY